MQLVHEQLVIVTRPELVDGSQEVLTGQKQRGLFTGFDVFPGGKTENGEMHWDWAATEVRQETGVRTDPDTLQHIGTLLIHDFRPTSRRFGNVVLYHAEVAAGTEAITTPELLPRWRPLEDPTLTDTMPPDVSVWWPVVRDRLGTGRETTVHVNYAASGDLTVIVKDPNIAHDLGKIHAEATIPAPTR
jgi:8-oxo-dGTP pyrophosphatase MutT (NUDIX family)